MEKLSAGLLTYLKILQMLFQMIIIVSVFVTCTYAQTGKYTLNGGTASEKNQTYTATEADQSCVYVLNSGNLTLDTCTLNKTGNSSNTDKSSQYGINASVLAASGGKITVNNGKIITNASGANGIFATGSGSSISMTGGSIDASGDGAHGVDATYGGSVTITNVNITTHDAHSSAVATDFGGGTVTVNGGTIVAASTNETAHSAGIYSTGVITVNNADVSSKNDCGGVIDGANSIILYNTKLSGATYGIMTWKTAPASGNATITLTESTLNAFNGDAFFLNGSTGNASSANISLKGGNTIKPSTGNIVNVTKSSKCNFFATSETLKGNFIADATSILNVTLNSTDITGSARLAAISMDEKSTWTVTAKSLVTTLSNAAGISGSSVTNITGNGNNVYYIKGLSGNAYLDGKTYTLVNGGVLIPDDGSVYVEEDYSDNLSINNYPNPFNTETEIEYSIKKDADIKLAVYDIFGREVSVLINEYQVPGTYKINFNANGLNSGIYLCSLISGNQKIDRIFQIIK